MMTEKNFTDEALLEITNEIDKLNEPVEAFVTGLTTDADKDNSQFETEVTSTIDKNLDKVFEPRNRAERRALDKATRRQKAKKKKMYVDSIKEATRKLAYIDMIEKVREMNERIKKEGEQENEATN